GGKAGRCTARAASCDRSAFGSTTRRACVADCRGRAAGRAAPAGAAARQTMTKRSSLYIANLSGSGTDGERQPQPVDFGVAVTRVGASYYEAGVERTHRRRTSFCAKWLGPTWSWTKYTPRATLAPVASVRSHQRTYAPGGRSPDARSRTRRPVPSKTERRTGLPLPSA